MTKRVVKAREFDWQSEPNVVTGWRTSPLVHSLVHRAYALGLIAGSGSSTTGDPCRPWRLFHVNFTGRRPYILGLERECWGFPFHLIRYRHWPLMVWGFCGKCGPWQCCGAIGYDHAPGCAEDPDA